MYLSMFWFNMLQQIDMCIMKNDVLRSDILLEDTDFSTWGHLEV